MLGHAETIAEHTSHHYLRRRRRRGLPARVKGKILQLVTWKLLVAVAVIAALVALSLISTHTGEDPQAVDSGVALVALLPIT